MRQMFVVSGVTSVLFLGLAVGSASADLRPGSVHPLMHGKQLALPLPAVHDVPVLHRDAAGRVSVRTRIAYVAANWKARKGVKRDRALVTLNVGRRLLKSGPDPSKPQFRRVLKHTLTHQHQARTYAFRLSAKVAAFLIRRGAFSRVAGKRAAALRYVWVDVQVDRDYQHVDGRFDWREGAAWNAASAVGASKHARHPAFAGSVRARAAANTDCSTQGCGKACQDQYPCATLTIKNATGNGVYVSGEQSLIAGTQNLGVTPTQTGVPIAVGATAIQCMDGTGQNGANPQGFANLSAGGTPQAYAPGAVEDSANGSQTSFGYAVTEPVVADDNLKLASDSETADNSGYLQGTAALAMLGVTSTTPVPAKGSGSLYMWAAEIDSPDNWMSPGAVVSGVLDIVEALIDNSCDGYPNLLGLGVTEPGSGTVGGSIAMSKEGAGYYGATNPTTGQVISGIQENPSLSTYGGDPLYLNPLLVSSLGVAGRTLSSVPPNNEIDVVWNTQNPCTQGTACNVAPVPSPPVQSDTGNIDCGSGNLGSDCAFPAGSWPPASGTPVYAGLSNGDLWLCNSNAQFECGTVDLAGGSSVQELAFGNGLLYAGLANHDLWRCIPAAANQCDVIDTMPTNIEDILYAQGTLYVALANGQLVACNPNQTNACETFDTAKGTSLLQLSYGGGRVWASLGNKQLWSCSPTIANDCQVWDQIAHPILSLAFGPGPNGQDTVFVGQTNGAIWACPAATANACDTSFAGASGIAINHLAYVTSPAGQNTLFATFDANNDAGALLMACSPANGVCPIQDQFPTATQSLAYGSGNVYAGLNNGQLWSCSATQANACTILDSIPAGAYPISLVAGPPQAADPTQETRRGGS